jgi:hypothetical protein
MGKRALGLADGWKWSLNGSAVRAFAAAMGADVALAYATSPKYSVDASGPQLVQADAHPAEGCHIELTVIEFAGRPWPIFLLESIWIGGIDGPDFAENGREVLRRRPPASSP